MLKVDNIIPLWRVVISNRVSMLAMLVSTRKASSSILVPSSLLQFLCTREVVRGILLLQAHNSRMLT